MSAIEFFGCAGDYFELADDMLDRTRAVLASGQVLQGAFVATFEQRVAEISGRQQAVAVGSGTDALFFALVGAGVGPGDEVLVSSVTFLASATAIVRTGAQPIFVDIGSDLAMDLQAAELLVTTATRALVCVQLFGGMGDPYAVETFTARHGLTLVEDFAQSLGARYRGRLAGSLGIAGATSFDPTKVIGSPGSGGVLVTDDDTFARRIRRLRLHGKEGTAFLELGYNSQLPTLSAAILDLKLDRHAEWTSRRAAIAHRYTEGLSDLPLSLPPACPQVDHVWHKFVILTDRRDQLAAFLKAKGIPTRIHYDRPLHQEPIFSSAQRDTEFPNAIEYCRQTLSLPIHSHLTGDEADQVVAMVRCFFA